ncbi:MAG: Coenzyme F420 hydrogenase/dehydrogenase, beta subunit C-terminal domain [Oscillospiraceae bacterium]|nr:Coenzyme F420 hydrogenase/dehydrogenase, beta subunit C-terminal domain [Oscillospiraceae bacterium]
MQICEQKKCVGCFSCVNSCPKGCISMEENSIGHIYPKIKTDICIGCGICKTVCPVNSDLKRKLPQKALAAYSLDEKEHKTSTSGGVASVFSRYIIENGGVVYGASSKINKGISHIRVDKMQELHLLKGSKYVHSYINNCFSMAKEDLEDGKQVLFLGTPCQIAGLVAFLKKDYKNLIKVDLICHGVPPQKLLFENLKNFPTDNAVISFRGPDGSFLKVTDLNEKIIYKKSASRDLYYLAFNKNLYLRDSCYSCDYSCAERCSDITIGDFWGLGANKPFNGKKDNGVSVVLPNTDKGVLFWDKVKDNFFYEEREIGEAIEGNHNLRKPTVKHSNSELFKKEFSSKGFKSASYLCLFKDIIKYRVLDFVTKNKKLFKLALKLKNHK